MTYTGGVTYAGGGGLEYQPPGTAVEGDPQTVEEPIPSSKRDEAETVKAPGIGRAISPMLLFAVSARGGEEVLLSSPGGAASSATWAATRTDGSSGGD